MSFCVKDEFNKSFNEMGLFKILDIRKYDKFK